MRTPPTFLVVDDSKLHHQMYNLVLSRGAFIGSPILHAYHGREGYAFFQTHPEIAAVFLDLNMPEMNGLEFLARREADGLHPGTPVILVTTEDTPADEARGMAAGAWAYLRKPFTPDQLVEVATRALSGVSAGA